MNIKDISYTSFFLGVLSAVSAGYFVSENFRINISNSGIDATLVTGLITSFALLASIINSKAVMKQYTRERNFTYRMSVKETFEEMSLIAIAKLYSIDARRQVCLETMKHVKHCLESNKQYRDGYGITDTIAFNADNCKSTAVLDIYFSTQGKKWNEVIDILNEMGTIASNTVMNYVENDYGKKTCEWISNIDSHTRRMIELDIKMGDKPKEIRDAVIEEVNLHTFNLTKV